MADPWTQKTLKQSPGNGAEGGLSPEQNLMSYIEPGRPAELSSVLTAILQALRDFTCHPSGAGQVMQSPISLRILKSRIVMKLVAPWHSCFQGFRAVSIWRQSELPSSYAITTTRMRRGCFACSRL